MRFVHELISILCITVLIIGCAPDTTEVETFVGTFLSALQQEEEVLNPESSNLVSLYPEIQALGNPSSLSEQGTLEIKKVKGLFEVKIISERRNQEPVYLMIKKDKDDNYEVRDSKGLIGNSLLDWAPYAIKTGCLSRDADLTDLQKAGAINKARMLYNKITLEVKDSLSKQLEVVEWKWNPVTSSGKLRVKNNTGLEIQGIDYRLNLIDGKAQVVQMIEETLTDHLIEDEDIFEGQIKLEKLPKHKDANIQLMINADFLGRLVRHREYKGTECHNK